MSAQRPVIVATALGVVSPIGIEEFAENLYRGEAALGPSELLPENPVVGEVREFAPQPWLGKKGVRVLDRCARLLAVACHIALRDGELLERSTDDEAAGVGLVAGTMLGGVGSIVGFDWSGVTDGPSYVSPMGFANTVINAAAGQTAIKHDLRGVNSTISSGQSSGLTAIHYAAQCLYAGRAEALLAGGAEELCQQIYEGLAGAGQLASDGTVRPLATGRSGTALGEGAAVLLLETAEAAAKRGRAGLVEIAGFAGKQDASGLEGTGWPGVAIAAGTIGAALADAAVEPDQVSCLVVSASGSPSGDAVEAEALGEVFGDRLAAIPAYAPKAAMGETMGASATIAVASAALTLREQKIPPTPGAAAIEAAVSLSPEPRAIEGDYALVTSVGFYGDCAAMVLRRCR